MMPDQDDQPADANSAADPDTSKAAETEAPPAVEDDDPKLIRDGDDADPCPGAAEPAPAAGTVLAFRVEAATVEALKPVIAEKIYFADPATDAERAAGEESYRAAAARPDGALWKKYARADWTFAEIGEELREKVDGATRLERWIAQYLSGGSPLLQLFAERQRIERALAAAMGPRECRYRRAEDRLKAWEKASQDWKAPAGKIDAIVNGYAGLLETLRPQVHDGDPYAIYRYWFEVAPQHLRLRDQAVTNANAWGVKAIAQALADFPARRRALESGKVLDDGSLFLLDPAGAGRPLETQRKAVLARREAAATEFALRKTLFDDRPDLIQPLAKQLDDVKRREADAKKIFQT